MLLIKYSEIGVKGKNRYIFEDMLVKNIRSALKELSEETFVRKAQGRIYVECKEEETEEAISAQKRLFRTWKAISLWMNRIPSRLTAGAQTKLSL